MRVYVTGAKGFSGSHLTASLKRLGAEVFASSTNLADKDGLASELKRFNPEYVVHLAASSFVANKNIDSFYLVNVVGTRNLLDAIALTVPNVTKVLITSSAAVYGNVEVEMINEKVSPMPSNDYGISKLAMEMVCRLWMNHLPIIITRPFNFTGVGQSLNFVIPKIVHHFKTAQQTIQLGNVDVFREFGDVRDFVDSYISLMTLGQQGQIYNICNGNLYSLREVISFCQQISGRTIAIEQNPDLIRLGEIQRLGGEPDLLFSTLKRCNRYTIKDTLSWMLDA